MLDKSLAGTQQRSHTPGSEIIPPILARTRAPASIPTLLQSTEGGVSALNATVSALCLVVVGSWFLAAQDRNQLLMEAVGKGEVSPPAA